MTVIFSSKPYCSSDNKGTVSFAMLRVVIPAVRHRPKNQTSVNSIFILSKLEEENNNTNKQ
jgi:hypothetical protein